MKVCLFSRSMQLDWTPHLCTTTGFDIPTGRAQNMEPFQGEELQLTFLIFPHLALHPRNRVITRNEAPDWPTKEQNDHMDLNVSIYTVCNCVQLKTSFFLSSFDRVGYLSGAGSDYAAFVHYLGITSMDISYTYDRVRKKSSLTCCLWLKESFLTCECCA